MRGYSYGSGGSADEPPKDDFMSWPTIITLEQFVHRYGLPPSGILDIIRPKD